MSDKHYVHAPETTKLEALLKQSRPWFERYATAMIYGVAAIMAIAAGIIWFNRQPATNAAGSQALMLASTAEDYQDVADRFPDTEIADVARLRQAESILESAITSLFENRQVGVEELTTAERAFESLANRSDLSPMLRQRVLVGLARIAECRCDGSDRSVDAAVAAWQRLLDEYPDSGIFTELAEERIRLLPLETTRSFYAWFQLQDPKPGDDLALPQDRPADVPDIPDLSGLPGLDLDSLMTPNSGAGTAPGTSPDSTPTDTVDPAPADSNDSAPPATGDPASDPAGDPEPAAGDSPAADPAEPAATGETPASDAPTPEPSADDSPTTDTPAEDPAEADASGDAPATEAPAEESGASSDDGASSSDE